MVQKLRLAERIEQKKRFLPKPFFVIYFLN